MTKIYECVFFTASVEQYANKVLDQIDPEGKVKYRLYRKHCEMIEGSYVKNLSLINRPLDKIIILDNSPIAYSLHPENAIPVRSWY